MLEAGGGEAEVHEVEVVGHTWAGMPKKGAWNAQIWDANGVDA